MLAAGGLGTPPILEKSGIPCQSRLFVDPVLYVADASILPKAMGNPPILTIMALAKKIAEIV